MDLPAAASLEHTPEALPAAKGRKRAATEKQPRGKKAAKTETAAAAAATVTAAAAAAGSSTNNEQPQPRDVVLGYMRQQNRPYNLQLIFDNLKRTIKKADLERLLDKLVEEGCLISKDFGKTRVFMYSQSQFAAAADSEDIAAEIKQLQEDVKELEPEAERDAKQQQQQQQQRSSSSSSSAAAAEVTAAEAAAAEHLHAKLHAAWAQQKRRCMQLLQQLSEQAQLDPQQLQQQLGLERDEDFIPAEAYANYN
ncbi:TBPIP domain-containing protein, putative [Eimeria brunetti]|uniref:TBPIP domain-containing protein, putative n=1 Tax=Eimeria brunetti TaxID=51314 RepID=U6LKG7_9EIME|nr:TBPIP domain-containing protein, putative [Eimeria brunetti]